MEHPVRSHPGEQLKGKYARAAHTKKQAATMALQWVPWNVLPNAKMASAVSMATRLVSSEEQVPSSSDVG